MTCAEREAHLANRKKLHYQLHSQRSSLSTPHTAAANAAIQSDSGHWYRVAAAFALALVVFWLLTGGKFDLLSGDGWIGPTDLAGSYAGSLVFQADTWRFPPGANPLFGNTSIVYSDSIPLAALFAKTIAGVFGKPVSYIGAWFGLNIFATALTALFLGKQLALPRPVQAALAILLTANVISLARMIGAQHLALSSTWLVLVAFLLVLRRASAPVWGLLLLLAAGVHAYLLAMCLAIYGCEALRRRLWLQSVLLCIVLAGWMYLLGYGSPSMSSVATYDFKPFGADLAFFFNSFNWGVIPETFKPAREPQFDALLFVGSGACLLIVASIVTLLTRRVSLAATRQLSALLVPTLIMLVAATGLSLQLGGHTLFDLPISSPWDKPFRTFRAVGRFGWAASYLLIIASVCLIASWRSRWSAWILCIACALQVADVANAHRYTVVQPFTRLEQQPTMSALNDFLRHNADHWNREVYKLADFPELEALQPADALLAKYGARFSATHSARQSQTEIQQQNEAVAADLAQRKPGLYVIGPAHRAEVSVNMATALQVRGYLFFLIP